MIQKKEANHGKQITTKEEHCWKEKRGQTKKLLIRSFIHWSTAELSYKKEGENETKSQNAKVVISETQLAK